MDIHGVPFELLDAIFMLLGPQGATSKFSFCLVSQLFYRVASGQVIEVRCFADLKKLCLDNDLFSITRAKAFHNPRWLSKWALRNQHGSTEIMNWLVEAKVGVFGMFFFGAAYSGNLKLMQVLWRDQFKEKGSERAIEYAAKNGHLEALRWLVDRDGTTERTGFIMIAKALEGGHPHIIDFVLHHPIITGSRADLLDWMTHGPANCEAACRRGDLERVKQTYVGNYWDIFLNAAAHHGHLEVVSWLLEQKEAKAGSDDEVGALILAGRKGHLAVVDLLLGRVREEATPSVIVRILDEAVYKDRVSTVRHLLHPSVLRQVWHRAVFCGSAATIAYLSTNHLLPKSVGKILKGAALTGAAIVLKTLLDNVSFSLSTIEKVIKKVRNEASRRRSLILSLLERELKKGHLD